MSERLLLTVPQVADALQVSQRTVRRMITDGKLQAVRLGRCVRITDAALSAFVTRSVENS